MLLRLASINACKPHVSPTRLINRDLSKVNAMLAEFSIKITSPGFKSAFKVVNTGGPLQLIRDIIDRIKQPWLINQSSASLCGPAAFMYCIVKDAPEIYVQYVRDLYLNGKASINQLQVEPSADCLNGTIESGESKIAFVDWIALASLRDSENSFFDYSSVNDSASGITLPAKLTQWFKLAGYCNVNNSTSLAWSQGAKHLLDAAVSYQNNRNVCLFVSGKALDTPFAFKIFPSHWVVMSGSLTLDKPPHTDYSKKIEDLKEKTCSLPVYNWGYEKYEWNAKTLSLDDLSDYYFGSVTAG
jgi:hypothetical protein